MYAGTLFRSRLEARWAVFFDELDIDWQFEPEGFVVGCDDEIPEASAARRYLPDFYLPDLGTWVEVKGDEEHLDRDLLCAAVDYGQGLPGTHESIGTNKGILLLGPIPRPKTDWMPMHPIIQHYKGAVYAYRVFQKGGIRSQARDDQSEFVGWLGDGIAGAQYKGSFFGGEFDPSRGPFQLDTVNAAYSTARSARFEHSHREVWKTTSGPLEP